MKLIVQTIRSINFDRQAYLSEEFTSLVVDRIRRS